MHKNDITINGAKHHIIAQINLEFWVFFKRYPHSLKYSAKVRNAEFRVKPYENTQEALQETYDYISSFLQRSPNHNLIMDKNDVCIKGLTIKTFLDHYCKSPDGSEVRDYYTPNSKRFKKSPLYNFFNGTHQHLCSGEKWVFETSYPAEPNGPFEQPVQSFSGKVPIEALLCDENQEFELKI